MQQQIIVEGSDQGLVRPAEDLSVVRGQHHPPVVSPAVVETDFTEIGDGSIVEVIEDPENSSRTLLAIYKNGEVSFTDRFQDGNRVLIPISREQYVIKNIRLPRGIKPYGSIASLLSQIDSIFSRCLDLHEQYRFLLACFVLSTWFIEKLWVAAYVAVVGLTQSGKSTALKLLSLLCRRSSLTADITSRAFYKLYDRFTPTLLIDETATAAENRRLFHLLRTGTTRDVVALRQHESYRTFGPKVVSWIELPNDAALNNRCIVIPLCETHRVDLIRPTDPEILHEAEDLQQQFLQARFEKFSTLKVPKVQGDNRLHSRARDLYEALALPISEDRKSCELLVSLLEAQQDLNRELSPLQTAVLQALFVGIHSLPEKNTYTIKDLTEAANLALQFTGEGFPVSPRAVGAALDFSRIARAPAHEYRLGCAA